MVISAPRANSIEIMALQTIKKLIGIPLMRLSVPWSDSIDNISLKTVKKYWGLTQ